MSNSQSTDTQRVNRTLISSTIVTVLLIALPIALNTISFEPFSSYKMKKKKKGANRRYQLR